MWQDGELRTGHKWHFQLYDALNRPVVSGIQYLSEQNIEAIRNNFKLHTGNLYEEWTSGGPLYGYSNSSFPVAYRPNAGSVLTISWYDNYDFKQLPEIGTAYNFPPIPPGGSTSSQYRTRVKGLITGNLERIDGLQGAGLINVNYYDERLRPICTVSDNHLDGRNNTFTAYDFNDNITETVTSHYINGQQEQQLVLITRYAYDHQSRLLEEKLKFNDQDFITLRAMEYNAIGDLINTYLHKSATGQGFNQKVSNTYNIRGWLSKINDADNPGHSLFALDLRYQNPATAVIQPTPCYNGNISQMQWNGKYDQKHAYGFEYDHLNRIKQAGYADGAGNTSNAGYYSTAYAYDPNGNITHLDRKKENNSIDQLIYTYASNSNLLQAVNDESGNTEGYAPNSGSYGYDANGNMKYDPSKRIFVHYNHLNLPTNIEFDSDDYITYNYTPTGRKLSKSVNTWHTPETSETDYCGPIVYRNNEIHSIFTGAGRIVPIQLADEVLWQNEYNLTDHLGNVRVVFAAHNNGQPEVMQQTSYYPFGMTMQQQQYGQSYQANRMLYNGKELQDDELAGVSLDWYDYGARMYDAVLGRFPSLDPIANMFPQVTPYNYAENKPINCIDLWGLQAVQVSTGAMGALPLFGPWGVSMSFEVGFILDVKGDLVMYNTFGIGGSVGGAISIGINGTFYPNANDYEDLVGTGIDIGVATPWMLSGQANISFAGEGPKGGGTLSYGFPALSVGAAGYANATFTNLFEAFGVVNIKNVTSSTLDQISQTLRVSKKQAKLILAMMKAKIEEEEEKKWRQNSIFLEEVKINANRKTFNDRIQDMMWKSVRPNAYGNTGRYNKPKRTADQYYSDDFLKLYYDVP